MHIDRFIDTHQAEWARLAALSMTARRGPRQLEPGELDELVALYQRVSGHLARARTAYADPALHARLTSVVAEANAAIYGGRPRARASLRRFATETFPTAMWESRRYLAVAAAWLFVPAIAIGWWLQGSEQALDAAVSPADRAALLESEFVDYYSQAPAEQFSTLVLTNNIRVSLVAFALGCLLCLPGIAILAYNGLNIGVVGAVFVDAGEPGTFFGHIAPHGFLELTAIAVTAAAGLRVGWAMIAPGDRRRGDAVAAEGRAAVVLVLGCIPVFVVAGIIEGFVTPAPVPLGLRAFVGFLAWVAFMTFTLGRGRVLAEDQSRPVALASR
jgi:uncharacterized membrane protein SpoIIM required for sporulation